MRTSSTAFPLLSLLVFLSLSTGLLGCNQPSPKLRVQPPLILDTQQVWIKQHAIVLKTTDPKAPLDDLTPLQQLVGNASLVGLGEATHGSHEFFTMKHRLLEFLVEKMGFTMFAMEGSWSAGEKINQYVLNGQGDAAGVLQQFYFWTLNTQEVLDLLKWMRAYNADPSHTQKVSFAGFDCQEIESNTYDAVIKYLQAVDPQRVPSVVKLYQGLRPDPTKNVDQYGVAYAQLPQQTRQRYMRNAQHVYDLLNQHQTTYTARSSSQAFQQALQEARVIVQGAQFTSEIEQPQQANSDRDAFMAENIAWLHEHNQSGAKMVVWAHNGHIATWGSYMTMGWLLRNRYQSGYLALGTSFYEGSFNAHGQDSQGHITPVQPFRIQASKGSYNYELGNLGLPLYALDLVHVPLSGPVSDWINSSQPFFEIGSAYNPAHESSYYTPMNLPQRFDVIISIQKVTASQLIPLKD